MSITINKPIVGFSIVKKDNDPAATSTSTKQVEQMSETIKRPETLVGETYKIKPPQAEHALYVTINDIVLNQGTDHEMRRPFEIFLNSKNMEHFQWTIALTVIISAVFRKGGDVKFLVEELRSVFDPSGGYLKKGGKYIPSLVAEIGDVIELHLKKIGMMPDEKIDAARAQFIADKREKFAKTDTSKSIELSEIDSNFPTTSAICNQCQVKASVYMDGCLTCLNCGYSKCG